MIRFQELSTEKFTSGIVEYIYLVASRRLKKNLFQVLGVETLARLLIPVI